MTGFFSSEMPAHKDMTRLTLLVLELDAQAFEAKSIDGIVKSTGVDPRSLAYLASQRAMKALGITTRGQLLKNQVEWVRLASVYHEAFILGLWWGEGRTGQ